MKYCTKCGNEMADDAVICLKCGCCSNTVKYAGTPAPEEDKADAALIVLSVLFPIVGIILWALKNADTPKAARTYGIAALITCAVGVVLAVFVSVCIGGALSYLFSI